MTVYRIAFIERLYHNMIGQLDPELKARPSIKSTSEWVGWVNGQHEWTSKCDLLCESANTILHGHK